MGPGPVSNRYTDLALWGQAPAFLVVIAVSVH